MFILDPVNAITSIQFYKKAARQPLKRASFYLVYLSLVFALLAVISAKIKITPAIIELSEWLAHNVPPITIEDGKATAGSPYPTIVRHPDYADFAVMIDVKRTEPVTPALMRKNDVQVYLTENALYFVKQAGQVEVQDFSQSTQGTPIRIDAETWRQLGRMGPIILYLCILGLGFPILLFWKTLATFFYSLVALTADAVLEVKLNYQEILQVSLYAQTLVIAIQIISLFTPGKIPMFTWIAFLITGTYIVLAMRTIKAEDAATGASTGTPPGPPPGAPSGAPPGAPSVRPPTNPPAGPPAP